MSRVLLKKSSVVNKVPVTSTVDAVNGLEYGELAINYADEKLYFRNSANAIKSFSASSGTVTSVAALTLGTTGTDVTSTVANGTTTPVITLNIPTASATNRGALSAADWTTFNSKLSSYTEVDTLATVTGRGATTATAITLSYGTANGVAYLNGSKVLTTGSALVFDGTNLGIGTTSPARTLDVFGYAQIQNPNGSKIAPVVLPKTPTLEIFGGDTNENNPGSIGLVTPGLNVTAGQVRGSELYFVSSRSTTAQLAALTYTAITTGDNIGRILFGGDNGVNLRAAGATIAGIAGSAWSATNAEGYLTFSTTALNATASGERMRLDASGNLGIGTIAPVSRVSSTGNSTTDFKALTLRNANATTGAAAVLNFEVSTGTEGDIASSAGQIKGIRTGAGTSGAMAFWTSNAGVSTEGMRLDASGNLGLGVTPSGTYKFQNSGNTFTTGITISTGGGTNVANTVNIDTNGSGAARYYSHGANVSTVGSHEWHLASSSGSIDTQAMTLTVDGNLIVGNTTTANGKFMVYDANASVRATSSTGPSIRMYAGGVAILETSTNDDLIVRTNSVEVARFTTGGNIGIGTTSPSVKLDVKDAVTNGYTPSLRITRTSATLNDQFLAFYNGLAVDGQIGRLKNSDDLLFGFNSGTGFGEKMRLMTTGNVGINTTTPSEKLEVVGNIKHTGLVMTAGTNVDQIYTASDVLTLTTAWQDTSVNSAELTTGSYMVQVYASDAGVGGGHYFTYYTGVMSWYSGDTNEASSDEIVLHRAGHASNAGALFLRILRTTTTDANDMKLQIAGTTANTGTSTYTYKFRRLI